MTKLFLLRGASFCQNVLRVLSSQLCLDYEFNPK